MAAAEAALAANRFVTAIDVLSGLGWLPGARLEDWRRGRLPYMEAGVTANLHKLSAAMKIFSDWARSRGLQPGESAYVAWARDRHPLRFSKSGERALERAYCTHWVAPELSERKRERLQKRVGGARTQPI